MCKSGGLGLDKVTNEMLMAFVDGELDPAMRKEVEAALRTDPDLRARAAVFEATRQPIASVFDPILNQPLSLPQEGLRDGTEQNRSAVYSPGNPHSRTPGIISWFSGLFQPPKTLSVTVAFCAVFLGGLGLGFLLKAGLVTIDTPEAGLVAFRDDGLVAAGSLDHTLEKYKSGSSFVKTVSDGRELAVKPILTFRDHEGRICREYEITYPATSRYAGLACRTEDGDWNVLIQSPIKSRPTNGKDTVVASGRDADTVDAVVERIIKGDALGSDQEALLMNKGWRGQD